MEIVGTEQARWFCELLASSGTYQEVLDLVHNTSGTFIIFYRGRVATL
jgi:hypothetical protein